MSKTIPVLLCGAALAVAQMYGQAAAPAPRPAPLRSAEVAPDRKITFRVNAPKAAEVVLLFGEGEPQKHPMTKDDKGIWSVTIGPVEPEIYGYYFTVDGMKTIDLTHSNIKFGTAIDSSAVEVPGNPPRFDQWQNLPHGSVNMHTYYSKSRESARGVYVYVPAEYYTQPNKKYPILYLWHGGGGIESDWSRDGRAAVILDNLIAQNKAVPMIVAMPDNNFGRSAPGAAPTAAGNSYEIAEKEVLDDLIPLVEKSYRVLGGRENRAIAGLSAGGGTSFNVGMKRLDQFATVGEFSSGMFGGIGGYAPYDLEKISPDIYKDAAATNKKIRLLYMSCGTEDPRLPFQQRAVEGLRNHKINLTFKTFPGVHEWKVWRHSLNDMLPMLFR